MNTEININDALCGIIGSPASMDTLIEMINDLGLELSAAYRDA